MDAQIFVDFHKFINARGQCDSFEWIDPLYTYSPPPCEVDSLLAGFLSCSVCVVCHRQCSAKNNGKWFAFCNLITTVGLLQPVERSMKMFFMFIIMYSFNSGCFLSLD